MKLSFDLQEDEVFKKTDGFIVESHPSESLLSQGQDYVDPFFLDVKCNPINSFLLILFYVLFDN